MDLAATGLVVAVPTDVIAGQKIKAGVGLRVENIGDARASGRGTIELFLSLDHELSGDDPLYLTAPAKIKLKPGQQRVMKVKFRTLPSIPDGQYHVLARLNAGATVTEVDATNNVATDQNAHVNLAQPRIDLAGAFEATPTTARPGKTMTMSLTVFNSGNLTAAGRMSVSVAATADATADPVGVPLGVGTVKIKIPKDEIRTYRLKVRVPGDFPAGNYFLAGSLDTTNAFTETDEVNNPFPGFSNVFIG